MSAYGLVNACRSGDLSIDGFVGTRSCCLGVDTAVMNERRKAGNLVSIVVLRGRVFFESLVTLCLAAIVATLTKG